MPPTKTVGGEELTASAFAYVPDPSQPSTWKLRIDDAAHVGGAIAALGKGFRGQKAQIPSADRAAVVRKVKAAWLKFHPDKTGADFPLKEGAMDDDVKLVEVEVEGDFEELVEAKLRRDGTVPIKVIRPGWGSSGYYPEKTLSKDYPVFEGARMFWNHPRRSDDDERPERDLNDLAAVLSNVRYAESGPKGPGIYGDAKVFSPFRERVGELAPYIGVSILANGKGTKGEVEGREGLVIESITSARSVDFVTAPGAGGEVVSLFESALTPDAEVPTPAEEVKHMEELKEALDRVQELETELSEVKERNEWLSDEYSRLKEAELVGQARAIVERALSESDLPEVSQTRLMESLTANPPVEANEDDITLDADGMESTVKEAIKAELTYIASLTESGRITGMGRSEEPEDEGSEKMAEAFERLGLSESAAKIAAVGR